MFKVATRLIAAWYQMGQDVSPSQNTFYLTDSYQEGFPAQGIGMAIDYTAPHKPVYARDSASQPILLQGAIEGQVLVKNVNNALPLKSPKLLSIFGYDAVTPPGMDVGSSTNFLNPFTLGYEPQLNYNGFVNTGLSPPFAPNGTMISGGKFSPPSNDRVTTISVIQLT
jgi:beta-glucosidase